MKKRQKFGNAINLLHEKNVMLGKVKTQMKEPKSANTNIALERASERTNERTLKFKH